MHKAKVGPELDVLVLWKVGGWRWYRVVNTAVLIPQYLAEEWEASGRVGDGFWQRTPLPDGPGKLQRDWLDGLFFYDSSRGGHTMPDIPPVSKDIGAAWRYLIDYARAAFNSQQWEEFTSLLNHTIWRGRADGDAPVEVCAAAMLAVGEEVEIIRGD